MSSVYETQLRLWSEQLKRVLYSQDPVDELSLRVAAGVYAALRQHRVDKHGRCGHCCQLRPGWWPRRRRTCTLYLAFTVAMNQPIDLDRTRSCRHSVVTAADCQRRKFRGDTMGRRATCYDNAVAESFFATYKKELIHTRPWNDLTEVRQHTFLWIEGYYNRRRRHSTLGYLTPEEYELGYRKLIDLAA
ncbi:MAG: integrase core domain-containing protein [Actinomycetota bacterium]|nr:integrase core domain-containing protein [Actinomycetota bacterium]